jgi:hypothetical protein
MTRHYHFTDSGAHSWINLVLKNHRGGKIDFTIFDSKEFYNYLDEYAIFIKQYKDGIDFYTNVDVIRDPKRTWKVQKYLEDKHGLNPIPVVHYGTDYKWLERYLKNGYDYIGIGGPLKRQGKLYPSWADGIFDIICNQKSRKPLVKTHGFLVTTHKLMLMYPWYSVDSTTSKKMAYYSQILVPTKVGGEFCYTKSHLVIFIDYISPYTDRSSGGGRHFLHMSRAAQDAVKEWLDFIKVPFGHAKKDGTITQVGVTNSSQERVAANIKYFLWLQAKMPKWPWAWQKPIIRPKLTGLL